MLPVARTTHANVLPLAPVERISSRKHPLVSAFRAAARGRGASDPVVLDGIHLLTEALQAHVPIDVAVIDEALIERRPAPIDQLVTALEASQTRTAAVTAAVLAAASPTDTPGGVVALARPPRVSIDTMVARPHALILVLVDVQDPGNVGAVIRAAEAGGATGVIACGASADPFGWKALRGAMGSTFRLPVARLADPGALLPRLRSSGIATIATAPRATRSIWEVDWRRSLAVLLGSEGAGLPPSLVEIADEQVRIPMAPPVESLNVATAAAAIVFEASRQRISR